MTKSGRFYLSYALPGLWLIFTNVKFCIFFYSSILDKDLNIQFAKIYSSEELELGRYIWIFRGMVGSASIPFHICVRGGWKPSAQWNKYFWIFYRCRRFQAVLVENVRSKVTTFWEMINWSSFTLPSIVLGKTPEMYVNLENCWFFFTF